MLFNTVTVIGANSTMGCQIAAMFASFGKAKVFMVCRSLEKAENAIKTAALSVRDVEIQKNMIPADYSMIKDCIENSDLVYESVAENLEIKLSINRQINSYAQKGQYIASGTSGLSINAMSEVLNEEQKKRYMGVHFCNPPYMMPLCELIPTKYTEEKALLEMEEYVDSVLLRKTIRVKDSPAFLGNRIGMYCLNLALHLALEYKEEGGIDYIDAILGTHTGRMMPPLATVNFIGLDVHKAIVENLHENTKDYVNEIFILPEYYKKALEKGYLGSKAGKGLYSKMFSDGKKIRTVLDLESLEFRPVKAYTLSFAKNMQDCFSVGDYKKAFDILKKDESKEAHICINFLLKYLLYSIYSSIEVSGDVKAGDIALSYGFHWCPPMALLELLGKEDIISLCKKHLEASFLENLDYEKLIFLAKPCQLEYRNYFRGNW